ncbi:hypothetical protein Bca4012_004483 [Brassica carinata]
MDTLREKLRRDDCGEDLDLWRCRTGFKNQFSTKETWYLLREEKPQCVWIKGVWFKKATPKYSFVTWIAMLDRLSTMDRVSKCSAGVDVTCVLCMLHPRIEIICSLNIPSLHRFGRTLLMESCKVPSRLTGTLFRERNKRRHGEEPTPPKVLEKFIDKSIRNKLCLVKTFGWKFVGMLAYWFGSQERG